MAPFVRTHPFKILAHVTDMVFVAQDILKVNKIKKNK